MPLSMPGKESVSGPKSPSDPTPGIWSFQGYQGYQGWGEGPVIVSKDTLTEREGERVVLFTGVWTWTADPAGTSGGGAGGSGSGGNSGASGSGGNSGASGSGGNSGGGGQAPGAGGEKDSVQSQAVRLSSAKTADQAEPGLWAGVSAAAGAGIIALLLLPARRARKERRTESTGR